MFFPNGFAYKHLNKILYIYTAVDESLCGRIKAVTVIFIFARHFEDVTLSAGVDMDNYYHGSSLNQGTYTFASSFTVSKNVHFIAWYSS